MMFEKNEREITQDFIFLTFPHSLQTLSLST